MLALLDRMVAVGHALKTARDRHAALCRAPTALHAGSLRQHGCAMTAAGIAQALAIDIELNAQGKAVWLARAAAQAHAARAQCLDRSDRLANCGDTGCD
jgi:hypothetical protein